MLTGNASAERCIAVVRVGCAPEFIGGSALKRNSNRSLRRAQRRERVRSLCRMMHNVSIRRLASLRSKTSCLDTRTAFDLNETDAFDRSSSSYCALPVAFWNVLVGHGEHCMSAMS